GRPAGGAETRQRALSTLARRRRPVTPRGGSDTGPDATASPPTAASQTDEVGPQPPVTEAAPPPQEETDGPEQPVTGGETGVSIAVPGLPVGDEGTVDLGAAGAASSSGARACR